MTSMTQLSWFITDISSSQLYKTSLYFQTRVISLEFDLFHKMKPAH